MYHAVKRLGRTIVSQSGVLKRLMMGGKSEVRVCGLLGDISTA